MSRIKLQITSGRKSVGSVTFDECQTRRIAAWAAENECDVASFIKRAVNMAVASEKELNHIIFTVPAGMN